jgi:hypothetical protein
MQNRPSNHGVINNVEFFALSIIDKPLQSGAYHRERVLRSLGVDYDSYKHRGWYVVYFRFVSAWYKRDTAGFRARVKYAGYYWKSNRKARTGAHSFVITPHGLLLAKQANKKLKAAGLTFQDLLNRGIQK